MFILVSPKKIQTARGGGVEAPQVKLGPDDCWLLSVRYSLSEQVNDRSTIDKSRNKVITYKISAAILRSR